MREDVVRGVRHALGIRPVYKTVDTCAAEFAARTPYHYSSYDEETEVAAAREAGGDHPRLRARTGSARASSSTTPACTPRLALSRGRLRDRDGQLQPRDRLHRLRHLRPAVLRAAHPRGRAGGRARRAAGRARSPASSCQLGGQTPLGLAQGLEDAGVPIVGTSPEAIHLAEERGAFGRVLAEAGLPAPEARHGHLVRRGAGDRRRDRLPGAGAAVVRPGRARHGDRLRRRPRCDGYIERATEISPEHPVLVDRFLDDAVEIDVDALYDGTELLPRRRDGAHRGGRHPLRRLGVRAAADHPRRARRSSGSASPPRRSPQGVGVRGLLNIQFALGSDVLYVLEANPRASAARCRSSPRRPRRRWPRPPPG